MISFAAPTLLFALAALPALWWLLRVTPPMPRQQDFPAAILLRDLPTREETPARTPWWILLLRLLAAALVILGLARPVLGPQAGGSGQGLLLLVVDDGWASGPDWPLRAALMQAELDRAAREERPAALLATAPGEGGTAPRVLGPMPAADLMPRVAALRPRSWLPDRAAALAALEAWERGGHGRFETIFLSDGMAHGDGAAEALMARLAPLTVARNEERPVRLLLPPRAEGDRMVAALHQSPAPIASEAQLVARGQDGRALAQARIALPAGATSGETALDLPAEIRNQIFRLDVAEEAGAGATVLLDERFRRRPVGLLPGAEGGADAPLIGELFYLERALLPFAELRRGEAERLLSRPLSVLILADRPLEGPELAAVTRFVEEGGTLVRFAGPRLAEETDALLPVRLRAERQLGGSLSWEQPQRLAPFPETSPFAGLPIPAEVSVTRQVLAEPSADLAPRIWARLADGTPLVTGQARGRGRVVLFHVTANAEWSDLPLSGLFVQMLRRLVALSGGVAGNEAEGTLAPVEALDGFGRLVPPPPGAQPIPAQGETAITARTPPGWYGAPGAEGFRRALNLGGAVPLPAPHAAPPPGAATRAIAGLPPERDLGPWLLAAALVLLALDLLLSLRLRGLLALRAAGVALALLAASPAWAQDGEHALVTRLAFVATGDASADETARAGLSGLSEFVNRRTSASLAEPVGVVPGRDELSFFPLLLFVVRPDAQTLDAAAQGALNTFMRDGGIILFDTRDEGSGEGYSPGARAALRRVTQGLTIPPLMPVPEDHVLRRAFYLLPELPGRFAGGTVWVSREQDRANDSVSPVVIGGHDWASAWASDARGNALHAAIPGGARQRVLALRFGANLVTYALTGNYKGDQVHVPAILERLGN
ncbi:DUF4159 domain-containing protein [Sabulicella glaciei]|uniref:DUF4159 domain-containing protein n=1 Tax=Sabulicella glaciei TaxID=2984948 RepID=A0ABT3NYN4_9PROT|nr:DUF4159 domain-containing protein [Roseococcus sp. MDT2-1-1]MCW8087269.1 DUF4159 domain-containing protein [Roseococcus sp. MDT2-1-1]